MSDADVPADLVELKVEFLRQLGEQREFCQKLPLNADRVEDPDAAVVEQWQGYWSRLSALASQISEHPWLKAASNRYEADAAASRLARQQVAA